MTHPLFLIHCSKNVGKKAAEKWRKDWPDLITEKMMALLAATGTRMLLAGDDRARIVVQAFAEAINVLEKDVEGASHDKPELKTTVDKVSGVPKASLKNLTRFYQQRVPCECLGEVDEESTDEEEVSEEEDVSEEADDDEEEEEETANCSGCGACKVITELSACAGCNVATYCSVDCQREDWPSHSKECQRLNLERQQRIWAAQEAEEDDDESDYSSNDEDGSNSDYDSDLNESASSDDDAPKKKKKGKDKDKKKKKSKAEKEKKSKSEKGEKKKKKEKKSKLVSKNKAVQV